MTLLEVRENESVRKFPICLREYYYKWCFYWVHLMSFLRNTCKVITNMDFQNTTQPSPSIPRRKRERHLPISIFCHSIHQQALVRTFNWILFLLAIFLGPQCTDSIWKESHRIFGWCWSTRWHHYAPSWDYRLCWLYRGGINLWASVSWAYKSVWYFS